MAFNDRHPNWGPDSGTNTSNTEKFRLLDNFVVAGTESVPWHQRRTFTTAFNTVAVPERSQPGA